MSGSDTRMVRPKPCPANGDGACAITITCAHGAPYRKGLVPCSIDGLTSEVCVPLHDAGQPAGFLNVESTGVRLDEADLHLLAALGEQVGLAIERARLYATLRKREARLAHLALHDPLTGLPNRRGLGAALGAALARLGRGGRG